MYSTASKTQACNNGAGDSNTKNAKVLTHVTYPQGKFENGMTRLQLLILVIIAIIIVALSFPPWREYRKVSTADIDVETIAVAIKKYFKHTGGYPTNLNALVTDTGVEGWRGNYLESIPETPWGGNYVLHQDSYKVGIAKNHPRVPEKYRFDGVAEISRVYHEDARLGEKYWW